MDVSQYLEIFIDETNGHLQTLSDSIMPVSYTHLTLPTIA